MISEIISDFEVINIPKSLSFKKRSISDEVECKVCGKIVKNSQALGGHIAQMHKKRDRLKKEGVLSKVMKFETKKVVKS